MRPGCAYDGQQAGSRGLADTVQSDEELEKFLALG
jgi:hypothetical protein